MKPGFIINPDFIIHLLINLINKLKNSKPGLTDQSHHY